MPTLQLTDAQIAIYAPQVVALESGVEFASAATIAKELGISALKVKRIRQSEAYKRAVESNIRRTAAQMERMTRENTLEIRQKLSEYSGESVERLVELMRQRKDNRVALTAACELIDRDGRFAKVSRLMN